MIAQVATGIMNHFNQSATIFSSLEGRLFFQQAPQDVEFPYAVFYFVGASHEEIMSNTSINNIIDVSLQFNIFNNSQDGGQLVSELAGLLDDAFHWADISVDGYSPIKMQRQAILPVLYVDEIWQISITYELTIQQS